MTANGRRPPHVGCSSIPLAKGLVASRLAVVASRDARIHHEGHGVHRRLKASAIALVEWSGYADIHGFQ
ncbi:hypothetical protein [Alicyclobacillus sp. SP_1]|uniref:hypothetical protein n=1 Tax=Alicyclobacillus sp. SP_1 TaxID=2942475 RepID=UPI0021588594|nr:hypothetical protein [Alicyclobacillus sp. SP_1]